MVPDSFLHEKMLLCVGEHAPEFLKALEALGHKPTEEHNYRCYRFWKFDGFCAMWTGIGSGCVEPMMWEVLGKDSPIKEVVLVGTAGLIGNDPKLCGKVYAVTNAYACATGVQPDQQPCKASWKDLPANIPHRSSLSTDQYYGFYKTTQPLGLKLQAKQKNLRDAIKNYWRKGRLLEMEVAQFYFLCKELGQKGLKYIALKGVSNLDGKHETQTIMSQQILHESVATGLKLMGLQS
jgi:purine-nucleoside phosphorylase